MTGSHRAFGGRRDAEPPVDDAADAAAEDRALLARLRAGEDAAFGELFARHCDAVRRFAHGLVSDRAEAEDLTAEAFFRVLQAIRRGSGPVDNVRGYLLIVARRVAWEWAGRKRDVPVSDEELTYRVGADPDTSGQATERNLITRAFTSLPERWRSVLWKVEVEGERPAVVAMNFGLSPNATAALARRARQGLRAAYLQAHLTVERGGAGCRSVLEKLGAYTAGTIKGTERRRVRAHLSTCPTCSAMYDELMDVCSGLRAHAAYIAAPVAGIAMLQQVGAAAPVATGMGVTLKGVAAGVKVQVVLAATSAAAVGALGLALVSWGDSTSQDSLAIDDLDGRVGQELVFDSDGNPVPSSAPDVRQGPEHPSEKHKPGRSQVSSGQVRPSGDAPAPRDGGQPVPPQVPGGQGGEPPRARDELPGQGATSAPRGQSSGTTGNKVRSVVPTSDSGGVGSQATYDESLPVVSYSESTSQQTTRYPDYTLVRETQSSTRVNSANQTTTSTMTTSYTRPNGSAGAMGGPAPRTNAAS